MSKKVKVDRIIIQIGDKEIPLSMDEARELKEILADMFGKTVYLSPSPVVIENPFRIYPYSRWSITYDTNSSTASLSSTQ